MFFKRYSALFFIVLFAACQSEKDHSAKRNNDSSKKTEQTIKQDQKKSQDTGNPVASFSANMDDVETNNDFVVKVYPAKKPKQYKITIQFGANHAQDEVDFPPKQYYKEIALRKGSTNDECLLGFIDNNGDFKEMKLISCTTTQIKIKSLKAYYFTTKQK